MASDPEIPGQNRLRHPALVVLVCLASLWTAYFGKPILAPMAIAVLLKVLLSPLMRSLKQKIGLPIAVSAALVVGGMLGALGLATVNLAPAAMHWTEELPERIHRLEGRLVALTEPVAAITAATEKVGEKVEDLKAAATSKNAETAAVVRIEEPSWLAVALEEAQRLAIEFFVIVVMLYLLLIGDGTVLNKLQEAGTPGATRTASALQAIEQRISIYVRSVLTVHGSLGAVMAVVSWLIGMPNPMLWGLLAGIGNAVPFVGPLVVTSLLTIVSLTSFDSLAIALTAPATYVVLHLLENNLITPFLLGRWLSLSPVAIFVSLILMGFLWGIAGLLLAVPLLVALKITCEHLPALQPLRLVLDGRLPPDGEVASQRILAC